MRILVALMLTIMLTACVGVETSVPAPPVAQIEEEVSEMGEAAPLEKPVEMEELLFEGNGNTFLDRIEQATRDLGAPEHHEYTEILDADGGLWQGEVLDYSDRRILFLQAAGSGGTSAVSLDLPGVPNAAALAAAAPSRVESPQPAIRFVRARHQGDGLWSFDVTLEYPDTGWEDYADGWHVESGDGAILGTRILLHPHVGEQPFTRSLGGVAIPDDLAEVVIRSHDLRSGYGQETLTVPLSQAVESERYQVER